MIKCCLCEYEANTLDRHIHLEHNMSTKEYTLKYNARIRDNSINEKRIKTCLNKYGYENTFQVPINKEKIKILSKNNLTQRKESFKKTCLKKYGTEHHFQNESIKEKIKNTMQVKYGVNSPIQNKELRKKIKNTMKLRYGHENALSNKNLLEKKKETCMERHGCENSSQNLMIQKRINKTLRAKYGARYNIKKYEESMLEKYGAKRPIQNKELKNKIKITMLDKYNVEHALQNEDSFKKYLKTIAKRKYYNVYCQSLLEKKFVDACIKNNFTIDNVSPIKYFFNNKEYYYYIDFIINEKFLIEIKANHIWYKNDLITGKHDAKIKAAKKYAKENNMQYYFLLDYDSEKFDKFLVNLS